MPTLCLNLRIKPNKRRPGPPACKDGVIELGVSAPPVEGKANVAVLAALADLLNVPKSALTLLKGQQSRQKRVEVAGDDATLARIKAWQASLPEE